MEKPGRENGTLLLALIAGLSINGSFAALFSSVVPFSIFPLIALVLAVYCLHQRYLNRAMPDGMPKLAAACFLLGLLLARHRARRISADRLQLPAVGDLRGAGAVDRDETEGAQGAGCADSRVVMQRAPS